MTPVVVDTAPVSSAVRLDGDPVGVVRADLEGEVEPVVGAEEKHGDHARLVDGRRDRLSRRRRKSQLSRP